jgi:N-methylhydantoinase B
MKLEPEAAVSVETPGAGGYGPAAKRSPSSIADDLASGKYSAGFVERHYQSADKSREDVVSKRRSSRTGVEITA